MAVVLAVENVSVYVSPIPDKEVISKSICDHTSGLKIVVGAFVFPITLTRSIIVESKFDSSINTTNDTPMELDMSLIGSQCHVKDHHGGIKIVNKSGPESMALGMSEGKVILDGTVTNGSFIVAGNALLIDGSTGTTIDDTALLNSVVSLIQVDITNIIDIVTTIKKFDTNRTKIDENTFTLTVYDDDLVTPLQIYNLKDANGLASYEQIFERVPV